MTKTSLINSQSLFPEFLIILLEKRVVILNWFVSIKGLAVHPNTEDGIFYMSFTALASLFVFLAKANQ